MDPRFDADAITRRQARFQATAGRASPDGETYATSPIPETKVQMELHAARALVGRCPTMCSEREALQREARRELSVFEMVGIFFFEFLFSNTVSSLLQEPSTVNDRLPKVHKEWAVRKYQRAAAGQAPPGPDDIRPPHVLRMTMSYLMDCIVDRKDRSFAEVSPFISFGVLVSNGFRFTILSATALAVYAKISLFRISAPSM